jgi:hypothetical protein
MQISKGAMEKCRDGGIAAGADQLQ